MKTKFNFIKNLFRSQLSKDAEYIKNNTTGLNLVAYKETKSQNIEIKFPDFSKDANISVYDKNIVTGDVNCTILIKKSDTIKKLKPVLFNEISQTISKQIVSNIENLAELNRTNNIDATKLDFNVDVFLSGTTGTTSHQVLVRKLIAKVYNASNYIAVDGRIGAAQYVITNGNLAYTLLDDQNKNYNEPSNYIITITQITQIYPIGQLGNLTIYVDSYMRWDDNRIFLGRKNEPDQPGQLFVNLTLLHKLKTVNINNESRLQSTSRYALVNTGLSPEKQFYSIHITDTNDMLI
jgi:hypothetical protein